MRFRTRLIAICGLLASFCAALAVSAAPAQAAKAPKVVTRAQVLPAAAKYARAHGYRIGIAVLDTKTGQIYGAGNYLSPFASESVVKAMIAARLLLQGRMHGTTAKRAYKMITQSDDGIASAFYGSVGGDGLLPWIARHYHIANLGSRPRRANWWGNTHITAKGLVQFYAKVKKDKRVGPWLLNAMHHAHKYGSDGTYQFFGLKQADPKAAIKQGWGEDYDDWGRSADFNSTGFVDNFRYAVAILARGPVRTYGAAIGNMLTQAARRLLPGGHFPDPVPTVRSASSTSGRLSGGQRVTLHGAAFTHVIDVAFGAVRGTAVKVLSATTLQVTSPRHAAGTVTIRVATRHGTSGAAKPRFTFVAPPAVTSLSAPSGPTSGGTSVTVKGRSFRSVSKVLFGGTPGTALHVSSTGSLSVTAPAHAPGPVDVQVVTAYGASAAVAADRFTYVEPQ